MTNIASIIDWQTLLLICPHFLVVSLFGYLLWSDMRHDRSMES